MLYIKKPKIIWVRWADSISSQSWKSISGIVPKEELEQVYCESIGWLVYEDKNILILVSSVHLLNLSNDPSGANRITIPKPCVVKRKNIKC